MCRMKRIPPRNATRIADSHILLLSPYTPHHFINAVQISPFLLPRTLPGPGHLPPAQALTSSLLGRVQRGTGRSLHQDQNRLPDHRERRIRRALYRDSSQFRNKPSEEGSYTTRLQIPPRRRTGLQRRLRSLRNTKVRSSNRSPSRLRIRIPLRLRTRQNCSAGQPADERGHEGSLHVRSLHHQHHQRVRRNPKGKRRHHGGRFQTDQHHQRPANPHCRRGNSRHRGCRTVPIFHAQKLPIHAAIYLIDCQSLNQYSNSTSILYTLRDGISNIPHPTAAPCVMNGCDHSILESLLISAFCSASTLPKLSISTEYLSNSAFFSFSRLFSSIIFRFLFSVSLSHLFRSPNARSFYFSMRTAKSSRHSVKDPMFSSREMTLVMNYMERDLRWSDSLNFSGSSTRMLFSSSKAIDSFSAIFE